MCRPLVITLNPWKRTARWSAPRPPRLRAYQKTLTKNGGQKWKASRFEKTFALHLSPSPSVFIFLPKHLFVRWFSSALLAPASPRETEDLVKIVGTFHAWNVLLPAAQYFGLLSALVIETDAQILIQAS
jgi:hypothetical protein